MVNREQVVLARQVAQTLLDLVSRILVLASKQQEDLAKEVPLAHLVNRAQVVLARLAEARQVVLVKEVPLAHLVNREQVASDRLAEAR
ncbi:hypothetical protein DQ04_00181130 [Trypanosoma grayi]|uniref:hypothetical protein n=1 Tax=Trypanosoma grayi TaxID=71804 RepID=UPI0004F47528|nr:hypothetical protein DQ04_00181130 [Trypanosoma grayi]KEG15120.1 hypothetical protein DQ04_00181130 [Trypanosoma grayi]